MAWRNQTSSIWFFIFHTWICSSNSWLAWVNAFCIWGDEFTGKGSIWRVLPLSIKLLAIFPVFVSHPVISMCVLCSMGNSRNNTCILHTRSIASGKKNSGKTIWFPPFWSVCSPYKPSLKTQYPQRESCFLQWSSNSPFQKRATLTKVQCWRRSFLPFGTWQSQQETKNVGTGSGNTCSPKVSYHREPSPVL